MFLFFIWWGINNKVLKPKIAIAKHAKTDDVGVVVYVVNNTHRAENACSNHAMNYGTSSGHFLLQGRNTFIL